MISSEEGLEVGKLFTMDGKDVWEIVSFYDRPSLILKNLRTGEEERGAIGCPNLAPFVPLVPELAKTQPPSCRHESIDVFQVSENGVWTMICRDCGAWKYARAPKGRSYPRASAIDVLNEQCEWMRGTKF